MGFTSDSAKEAGAKSSRKGSGNKNLDPIREAFSKLIEDNLDNMTKWLKTVAKDNPKQALDIIQGLSEYCVPKLARTELTGEDGKDLIPSMTDEEIIAKINRALTKGN